MPLKQYKGTICLAAATIGLIVCNFFAIHALQPARTEPIALVSTASVAVSSSEISAAPTTETTLPETTQTEAATAAEPETTEAQASPYKIVVYIGSQSTVVYKVKEDGSLGAMVKKFTCSTGAPSSPTSIGEYEIKSKQRWCSLQGNVYGQFCCYIGAHYLFHSVPYLQKDPSTLENEEYDSLGKPSSMGCIRMCVRDCKWVYDNMPKGTPVTITKSKGPAGPGYPKRKKDPIYNGWDPSDRWAKGNPYFDEDAARKAREATSSATAETSAATEATSSATAAATATTTAPAADPSNPSGE